LGTSNIRNTVFSPYSSGLWHFVTWWLASGFSR